MRLKDIHKSFLREDQGAVAIITAVVLTFVLLGIAALAIDIGRQASAKNELQNAVDAAALAGAKELALNGHDLSKIIDAAQNVAAENKVDNSFVILDLSDIETGYLSQLSNPLPQLISPPPTGENYNAVRVTVDNHGVSSFFGQILGINQSVSVTAKSVVGPAKKMGGDDARKLVPIGVKEEVLEQILDDPEHTTITKYNFDTIGAGNWGFVNLGWIYGERPTGYEQSEYIRDGYDNDVSIGQIIHTDTGANIGSPGNLRQILGDVLDSYVESGEVLYITVLEDILSPGTSEDIEVVNFVAVKITDYGGSPPTSEFEIEMSFPGPDDVDIGPGPVDLDKDGYGVKNIVLVK